MWQKLVESLKPLVKNELVKSVTSAILKALGVAGGFWTWIVGIFVGKAADKAIKEAESAARVEDRENSDEGRKEKYDELMKEPVSEKDPVAQEKEIIAAEESILNGGRTRRKP